MGKIRECVEDVKRIASRSQDFDEAKQCIEQLLSGPRPNIMGTVR
jgi:hypothetical protein